MSIWFSRYIYVLAHSLSRKRSENSFVFGLIFTIHSVGSTFELAWPHEEEKQNMTIHCEWERDTPNN